MKLFISILLIPALVQAKLIKVKYDFGNEDKARQVVQILEQKFYIPSLLIQMQQTSDPCHQDKKTIVHLCLDQNNELQMPWMDRERFNFTLSHMVELPVINLAKNNEV